jgi:hypothetical protein
MGHDLVTASVGEFDLRERIVLTPTRRRSAWREQFWFP